MLLKRQVVSRSQVVGGGRTAANLRLLTVLVGSRWGKSRIQVSGFRNQDQKTEGGVCTAAGCTWRSISTAAPERLSVSRSKRFCRFSQNSGLVRRT